MLGVGSGLGSAIAMTLTKEGARVALADIDVGAVDRLVADIRQAVGSVVAVPFDLADRRDMEQLVAEAEGAYGAVDVLVNNTGGPPPTPASGQIRHIWSKSFEQMVLSVIALTDRVLLSMRERKWGPDRHLDLIWGKRVVEMGGFSAAAFEPGHDEGGVLEVDRIAYCPHTVELGLKPLPDFGSDGGAGLPKCRRCLVARILR